MMATLSIPWLHATAFEVFIEGFSRRNSWSPPEPFLNLLIRITSLLPVGVPDPPIECWRQLPLRPSRIFLPHCAQQITGEMGDIYRFESAYVALVEPQESPARGQVVVDNIEHLPV